MFRANNTGIKFLGKLVYEKSEYSFNFEPVKNTDINLMIGYLYLGVDSQTMLAKQVWGYNPYNAWIKKKLTVPIYFTGELSLEEEIQVGISKRLVENGQWLTSYDLKSGWICIGDDSLTLDNISVEFATNIVATLNKGRIKAIWLKPDIQ